MPYVSCEAGETFKPSNVRYFEHGLSNTKMQLASYFPGFLLVVVMNLTGSIVVMKI